MLLFPLSSLNSSLCVDNSIITGVTVFGRIAEFRHDNGDDSIVDV